MGNYRDVMSRRGCFATALAWTAIPALSAGFILLYTPDLPPAAGGTAPCSCCFSCWPLPFTGAAGWHTTKSQKLRIINEEESPHER